MACEKNSFTKTGEGVGLGWVGWGREGKGGGDIKNKEHTDQSWNPMLMMSVLISDRGI